jgi:nitroimidazol reductase NimA-like FMN-containing flavoprotein (pyridoxamine 5'-phosphate oxidase superfamily)
MHPDSARSDRGVPPSARTTLRRGRDRGDYRPDTVRGILAEGLYCTVAVCLGDQPAMIPTAYAVRGEHLYVHGSTANRMFRAMREGAPVCVSVTLLDGLVLARSAFHHSVNYRSVILYGRATEVVDRAEKLAALDALVDHVVPGRSAEVRKPNREEILRTLVLRIPVDEASAKVRSGPPVDEEQDYALGVWAGVLPLRVTSAAPVGDERSRPDVARSVLARHRALAAP